MGFFDTAADLLLQGACPGCGLQGYGLCHACTRAITAGRVGPQFRQGITVPLFSAGTYDHPLAHVMSQAKDHHRWDTLDHLSLRLAYAVAGLIDEVRPEGSQGVLVPFPSTERAVRSRGIDFCRALAERACQHLTATGLRLRVLKMLRHVRAVQDQSDLTTDERETNLQGALVASSTVPPSWIVVVDDVVTTGASLAEAVRALSDQGHTPIGLATIAATQLRTSTPVSSLSGLRRLR